MLDFITSGFGFFKPSKTESVIKVKESVEISKPMKFDHKLDFTPIEYKENNQLVLLMMNRHKKGENNYKGLTLVSIPNSHQWLIYDNTSNMLTKPIPNQSYAFVTMPDKSIRVALSEKSIHVSLSHYSPVVRYAGNVTFDQDGEIFFWDHISGGYRPSTELAHQAGFHDNDLKKFKEIWKSTPSPT